MLGFASKYFKTFIEILLWLILVVCAIAGYNIGSESKAPTFICVVGGVLIGLIINIVYGGLLATFLKMNENLENIDYDLEKVISNIKDINAKLANNNEADTKPAPKEESVSKSDNKEKPASQSDSKPIFNF